MNVLISLVERDGAWSICRDSIVVHDRLRLGPAIKLARQLARDEHRCGHDASVLLTGLPETIVLARYESEPAAA